MVGIRGVAVRAVGVGCGEDQGVGVGGCGYQRVGVWGRWWGVGVIGVRVGGGQGVGGDVVWGLGLGFLGTIR